MLLVDGDQRVSEVIKYLTQSSWSHAAMYIGDELWRRHPEQRADLETRFGVDARHLLVEALMEDGVVASPLAKYDGHNLRVCRPQRPRPDDCRHVIDEIWAARLALRRPQRALALARYFFPVSLIPRRWRRRALGSATTSPKVICSTLIARAFARRLPILPAVTPGAIEPHAVAGGLDRPTITRLPPRPCALITPRLRSPVLRCEVTGLADREIDYPHPLGVRGRKAGRGLKSAKRDPEAALRSLRWRPPISPTETPPARPTCDRLCRPIPAGTATRSARQHPAPRRSRAGGCTSRYARSVQGRPS